MRMTPNLVACFTGMTALTWGNAGAHHSFIANYDMNTEVELTGVVVDYRMRSPHSYITIEVEGEDGTAQRWDIESQSVPGMFRMGLDENSFQAGDVITVVAWPSRRENNPLVAGLAFFDADGAPIGSRPNFGAPDPAAAARTGVAGIEGRWLTPPPVGLTETPLPLNAAGRDAWNAFDARLSPANRCEYATIPSLFYAPYLYDIRIEDDAVVFTHEVFSVVRRVPLDAEPSQVEATGAFGVAGASIDGDELVIESSAYPASGWGLGIAAGDNGAGRDVPSSEQKRVVERYSINGEGDLRVHYTMEDPAYMTEPFSSEVVFSRVADDTPMHPFDCDTESAERYAE